MYFQLNFLHKAQGKPQCPHQMGKNDGKETEKRNRVFTDWLKYALQIIFFLKKHMTMRLYF